jgi:hypothetical protein
VHQIWESGENSFQEFIFLETNKALNETSILDFNYMPVSFNIYILIIEISSLIFSRLIIRSDNDFSFLIINLEGYF